MGIGKTLNKKLEDANYYGLRTTLNMGKSTDYGSILRMVKQSLIIFYKCFKENGTGYVEQLQNIPVKSRRGRRASRLVASGFSGGRIIERGRQFAICWLHVYAWIIERGNVLCSGYASRRGYAKSTGVRSVLSWSLDHRTRQFFMCWLRIYAWRRVKIKAKSTGGYSVI